MIFFISEITERKNHVGGRGKIAFYVFGGEGGSRNYWKETWVLQRWNIKQINRTLLHAALLIYIPELNTGSSTNMQFDLCFKYIDYD